MTLLQIKEVVEAYPGKYDYSHSVVTDNKDVLHVCVWEGNDPENVFHYFKGRIEIDDPLNAELEYDTSICTIPGMHKEFYSIAGKIKLVNKIEWYYQHVYETEDKSTIKLPA